MSQATTPLQGFIDNSKASQTIWGLQDPATDDWVVCDSLEFSETDVMPLWSTQASAEAYCADEWATYEAKAITIPDYLDYWAFDLNDDGVLLGLDWLAEEETSVETDPIVVAKAFAELESLSA